MSKRFGGISSWILASYIAGLLFINAVFALACTADPGRKTVAYEAISWAIVILDVVMVFLCLIIRNSGDSVRTKRLLCRVGGLLLSISIAQSVAYGISLERGEKHAGSLLNHPNFGVAGSSLLFLMALGVRIQGAQKDDEENLSEAKKCQDDLKKT